MRRVAVARAAAARRWDLVRFTARSDAADAPPAPGATGHEVLHVSTASP